MKAEVVRHPASRLTEFDKETIRARRKKGAALKVIAAAYNVSITTIFDICGAKYKMSASNSAMTDPNPLPASLRMLLQYARVISPVGCHPALLARAIELNNSYRSGKLYQTDSHFIRVIQNGIDFGKWLGHEEGE